MGVQETIRPFAGIIRIRYKGRSQASSQPTSSAPLGIDEHNNYDGSASTRARLIPLFRQHHVVIVIFPATLDVEVPLCSTLVPKAETL